MNSILRHVKRQKRIQTHIGGVSRLKKMSHVTPKWMRMAQETQKKIPSAARFVPAMPSNFHRSDWAGRPFGSLPGVQAVYTLPVAHAEMPVDEETSKHFQLLVAAADDVSFDQACEKLALLREDDQVPGGKRLHIPAFRNLLNSLCAIAILQRPWKGHRVLCSCCSIVTVAWSSFSFGK